MQVTIIHRLGTNEYGVWLHGATKAEKYPTFDRKAALQRAHELTGKPQIDWTTRKIGGQEVMEATV